MLDFEPISTDLQDEAQRIVQAAVEQASLAARRGRDAQPIFIHTCGIPGAGKTTHARRWLEKRTSFACVEFDAVMEQLTGYREDKARFGPKEAFERWELAARSVGYKVLKSLLEAGHDVFFDHSAANRMHIDLIRWAKSRGYFVEMHFIECAPHAAIERIKARSIELQRHTPETLVWERSYLLQELLPIYQSLVDNFIRLNPDLENTIAVHSEQHQWQPM